MRFKRAAGIIAALLVLSFLGLYVYLPHNLPDLVPNRSGPGWDQGPVMHILPTVNHHRMLLKVSFDTTFRTPPRLRIDERSIAGTRTDSAGAFWSFDVSNLEPSTTYSLLLETANGRPLTDGWPLQTFPAPNARPEHFRLLIFTCPGGHDAHRRWFGFGPIPLSLRKRLLDRALSFEPDAMISSGDQIYYDRHHGKSATVMGQARKSKEYAGTFDESQPLLGTSNEKVLKKAVSPQISYLFGPKFRSTPSFFLLDDHDYFENDVAMREDGFDIRLLLLAWRSPFFEGGLSFPPDDFMLRLARTAQHLYLPELLPDLNRPRDLPGASASDRAPGVSETYGTLRYGQLVEALLYEGRRYVTLDGEDATFVHPEAERWLKRRMDAEAARHVVNVPAMPFGWSAGKWMEWYPDVKSENGELTTETPKYKWQSGWFRQHNRILHAASQMEHSLPLFIGGDLHSQGETRILQSDTLDFRSNPIVSLLSGSLGTGPRMYPSSFRGTVAKPPTNLTVQENLEPIEKNGFLIVDFTPETVHVRFFAWRPPQPVAAIDTLSPHHELTLPVPEAQR